MQESGNLDARLGPMRAQQQPAQRGGRGNASRLQPVDRDASFGSGSGIPEGRPGRGYKRGGHRGGVLQWQAHPRWPCSQHACQFAHGQLQIPGMHPLQKESMHASLDVIASLSRFWKDLRGWPGGKTCK